MNKLVLLLLIMNQFGYTQSFDLLINNGTSIKESVKGEDIHVWADNPTNNKVFIEWTGNASEYLINPKEWHTILNIPINHQSSNFELTAKYKTLESNIITKFDSMMLWGEYNVDPSSRFPMLKSYYMVKPENPKAAVFIYHGTGGSAHSFFRNYDLLSLIKDFTYHNFVVFVFSSNETDLGDQDNNEDIRWNANTSHQSIENNIDLLNISEFKENMINDLDLGDIPFFGYGVSNGANFSDLSAAALDFNASAHMTAHGNPQLYKQSPNIKPTIWLQARNDNHPLADSSKAKNNYKRLINRGIESEWHWLDKSPLHPTRFTRSIKHLGPKLSKNIYQVIDSLGWLDARSILNFKELTTEKLDLVYSFITLTEGQKLAVKQQLKVINAEHGGHGEYNKTIIDFFDKHIENMTSIVPNQPIVKSKVFPNPCHDYLKVNSESKILSISIYNQLGQLITNTKESSVISLLSIINGNYIVKIHTKDGISIKNIIKI